jgi:hypothetical protein
MDIARQVFSVTRQTDGWYWRLDIRRDGLIGPFESKEDAEKDAKKTLGIRDREAPQSAFKMGFYGAGTLCVGRDEKGRSSPSTTTGSLGWSKTEHGPRFIRVGRSPTPGASRFSFSSTGAMVS